MHTKRTECEKMGFAVERIASLRSDTRRVREPDELGLPSLRGSRAERDGARRRAGTTTRTIFSHTVRDRPCYSS